MIFLLTNLEPVTTSSISWKYHDGSCYGLAPGNPDTFSVKSQACADAGASLLEIETSQELEFVRSQIKATVTPDREFWVGLQGSYSSYTWISSGNVVDATFWIDGEPNNDANVYNGVNCIRLDYRSSMADYGLADASCTSSSYDAICEKPASVSTRLLTSLGGIQYTWNTELLATWPLCHVGMTSRQSRVQCATLCSVEVTCVGFDFHHVTAVCRLVTLNHACPSSDVYTPDLDSRFYSNVARQYVDDVMCQT